MSKVQVLNTSFVNVLTGGDIIPLSFLDARWIHLPQPVQEILINPNSTLSSSSLDSFKSSLSHALSFFHPLAGTLAYQQSSDQLVIDCLSAKNGVLVMEAESDLNIFQLASEETYDTESFIKLVPRINMDKLPVPFFAVQITRFVGGGVTVGTAMNHCVMDGIGFWRFMEIWARMCSTGGTSRCIEFGLETNHDRIVILHSEKEEITRRFLGQLAPDLPQLPQFSQASLQDRPRLSRRTFILTSTTIEALKERATIRSTLSISAPSTFIAIAAHFWVCSAMSKGLSDKNQATSLRLLVDLRSHFMSRENTTLFTGNCIRGIQVKSTCKDLIGPNGLAFGCLLIAQAVRAVREEPIKGVENWPEEFKNRPVGLSVMVAGSPKFGAYEIDFGWGRPGRAELVSSNHDGDLSMFAGRDKGSVQVKVVLANEHMASFSNAFCVGLGNVEHCCNSASTSKL